MITADCAACFRPFSVTSLVLEHRTTCTVCAHGNSLILFSDKHSSSRWCQWVAPPEESKTEKGKVQEAALNCQWWGGTRLIIVLLVLLCLSYMGLLVHSWETTPRIAILAILLFVHLLLQSYLYCKAIDFFNQIVLPVKNFHVTIGNVLPRIFMWLSETCCRVFPICYSLLFSSPFSR